jgi:hypothetical protein
VTGFWSVANGAPNARRMVAVRRCSPRHAHPGAVAQSNGTWRPSSPLKREPRDRRDPRPVCLWVLCGPEADPNRLRK